MCDDPGAAFANVAGCMDSPGAASAEVAACAGDSGPSSAEVVGCADSPGAASTDVVACADDPGPDLEDVIATIRSSTVSIRDITSFGRFEYVKPTFASAPKRALNGVHLMPLWWLELHKFQTEHPVRSVLLTQPSNKHVFDIRICSCNRSLTLGMSWLAVDYLSGKLGYVI